MSVAGPRPYPPSPLRAGDHPWEAFSYLKLSISLSFALVVLLSGYVITSGTLATRDQLIGLNLGLAAVVLEGVTALAWVITGMRAVRERERLLTKELAAYLAERGQAPAPGDAVQPIEEPGDAIYVAVAGGTLRHLRTCPMVANKALLPTSPQALPGRPSCRVCQQ